MALRLTLIRCNSDILSDSIQGELYLNGVFFCHTVERLSKAIPRGCFSCGISYSPKFKKKLPYVSVKGRSGIRFHAGNTSKDSSGCILVGKLDKPYTLINSRLTLQLLMSKFGDFNLVLTIK